MRNPKQLDATNKKIVQFNWQQNKGKKHFLLIANSCAATYGTNSRDYLCFFVRKNLKIGNVTVCCMVFSIHSKKSIKNDESKRFS